MYVKNRKSGKQINKEGSFFLLEVLKYFKVSVFHKPVSMTFLFSLNSSIYETTILTTYLPLIQELSPLMSIWVFFVAWIL